VDSLKYKKYLEAIAIEGKMPSDVNGIPVQEQVSRERGSVF